MIARKRIPISGKERGGKMVLRIFGAEFLAATLLIPAARADDETVTIQLVKSTGQSPFYIATGKGYFAEEGIKVDAGNVRSALDTIAPMATGRLDGSMGAATAGFFKSSHQGFDIRNDSVMGLQGPLKATQPLARK
jgi:ABC-type nitrate/sulfonate/bicarbonate transport system substrate-binding protein